MNWHHNLIHHDQQAEGSIDGGTYRAWVGRGYNAPDVWNARLEWLPVGRYYAASNRHLPDEAAAKAWAEAALPELRRVAERLGEVKV